MKRRSNLINTNRYACMRLLRFARNDIFGIFYEVVRIRGDKKVFCSLTIFYPKLEETMHIMNGSVGRPKFFGGYDEEKKARRSSSGLK